MNFVVEVIDNNKLSKQKSPYRMNLYFIKDGQTKIATDESGLKSY